jgi:hypothetical protein
MRRLGGILLVLALAMASKVRGGDEKKMGDLKALQGTWTRMALSYAGTFWSRRRCRSTFLGQIMYGYFFARRF